MLNVKLIAGKSDSCLLSRRKLSTINRLSKIFIPSNKPVSKERESIDAVHKSYNVSCQLLIVIN